MANSFDLDETARYLDPDCLPTCPFWSTRQNRLTLSTLGKKFSGQHFEIFVCFSDFSQKTGFAISCKLSPVETICMKCQILFPGKKKIRKNIINLSSAE